MAFSEEVERRIEDGWQAVQAMDPRAYNGPLLRVLSPVRETDESVSVAADIGYREVVGMRRHKDLLGWVPTTEQFQVLSAIAFVETADGRLLFRERNTGDWEHSLELSGGFIVAKDVPDTVGVYIRDRVAADLLAPPDVIYSLERIGHIDFKSICESMFVYKIRLAVTLRDLTHTARTFVEVPKEYTLASHQSFFPLPLHPPSKKVLELFLPTLR